MQLLWMLIVGLIIGLLARVVVPVTAQRGPLVTVAIAIGGSVIAGYLGLGRFIASVLGAVLLLAAYRAAVARSPAED